MRYRKQGIWHRLAHLLGASCALAFSTGSAGSDTALDEDWSLTVVSDKMADGSTLHEYRAITKDKSRAEAALFVAFHPRFSCEPIISMSMPLAQHSAAVPADKSLLPIIVDGRSVEWPVTVDIIGDTALMTLDSGVVGQHALRNNLDRGNYAQLRLADDQVIWFSLLGSRKAIADAHTRCRAHQPEEWVRSETG